MSKKPKRKQTTLQRAAPQLPPGGALMYLSPQQLQSVYGQTFYGSSLKNTPVGQTSLFSPGVPLPTQPGANPQGMPVQYRFPISYNTFPVDRSQGMPDIPSFEQLRRFAKMYSGIGLCERFWLDMVPRMTLNIKLKKEYADQGAEEKDYQKEISFFRNFFDKPDGRNDLHTWIRKALREQTQIDELYIYKHRKRGGKMLGLWIVDGSQMKPLLDDWGMQPDAPAYAYQQYPWGIPGMQYSSDMMIHYQETPAAETPYGTSRVERIIFEVNQALKKKKKDMGYFTEGNQPFAFMEVPEDPKWTPDEIDSFQQSFDALNAGNPQQQNRIKFLQPGMKYQPIEQYQILTDFDLFLLKIACAIYGVPPSEFGFVEDSSLSSSGESQEDVVYRRTIEPLALVYAMIITGSMNNDFPPECHGEMFEAEFSGYAEKDDEQKTATAITTYTGAGVLGLTDAAKLANLPVDPDAPQIGRVYMSAQGPVFLDDVATPEMRKAQQQATMAGYQMATNPPEPQNEEQDNEQGTPANAKSKAGTTADSRGGNSKNATGPTKSSAPQSRATGDNRDPSTDYRNWRTRAIEDVKQGRVQRSFASSLIPEYVHIYLSLELEHCLTADDVRDLFKRVQDHQMEVVQS